jgi:hypothetical protein
LVNARAACIALITTACAGLNDPQAGPTGTPTPSPALSPIGLGGSLPEGAPEEIVVAVARSVDVVSARTGEVLRRLIRSPVYGAYYVQLSGDGETVYIGRETTNFAETPSHSEILRVPFAGGTPEVLVEIDGILDSLAVSPDERRMLYGVSNGPDEGLFVHDLGTATSTGLTDVYIYPVSFSSDGSLLAGSGRATRRGPPSSISIIDMSADPPTSVASFGSDQDGMNSISPVFRGKDDLLVFEFRCAGRSYECLVKAGRQLVVDPADGTVIETLPDRGAAYVVAFDRSGEHALFHLQEPYIGGDYWPNSLWRLDAEGRLVEVAPGYYDADW